ncbi:hypothetical protein COX95_03960 [bacterium CG_4_10_14_0_2_um_filter_33_32]|nr:MAG: hypothetical protein AUJ93_00365 [bacterium CG2_30_33_46]PIR67774.1 MAG: hypothetical protein COU50_01360 [bacterium CG10_big_fil_rev_8_21_14_0_10_33_18]PIU76800.1 MAG: hypothetical protein COS74_01985 [bacterium CG06_land_8_20_14_3_00_33_50]PIW81600.1 MAG: hypothetical protein COZ97_00760 [bacterium CG_4_8_14_3_um_filter_33_28]PIY85542.1 MAG: hypothetical protein COY76_01795 [bacterium CG_4_10_14_0_8_um_filter_33_57]PIZ85521.1 MAG: hypothetical protein COX95_03960 [bacterium CG_4_10_1
MFRKKNELSNEIETIVGPSVALKGNLHSDGNIIVKGVVSGEIKTQGDILVDEGAEIKASVSATNIKIAGTVNGDLVSDGEIEITETGKVIGNINSSALIIRVGAVFIGKSVMELNEDNVNKAKEDQEEKEEQEEEGNIEPEPEIEE